MSDVAIDKRALLSLCKLDDLPACDEGMDLAHRFLLKAGEAVDRLDEADVFSLRNVLIRAHKELAAHRAECPKCNEAGASADLPL